MDHINVLTAANEIMHMQSDATRETAQPPPPQTNRQISSARTKRRKELRRFARERRLEADQCKIVDTGFSSASKTESREKHFPRAQATAGGRPKGIPLCSDVGKRRERIPESSYNSQTYMRTPNMPTATGSILNGSRSSVGKMGGNQRIRPDLSSARAKSESNRSRSGVLHKESIKKRMVVHRRTHKEIVPEHLRVSLINELDAEGRIPEWLSKQLTAILMSELKVHLATQPSSIPSFRGSEFVQGHLRINCTNNASLEFLMTAVQKIGPTFDGIRIGLVQRNQTSRLLTAKCFIPKTNDGPNEAVTLLELQNPHLKVDRWKRFHAEVIPDKGIVLVFGIDEVAATSLKASGGTANFGFTKINVKVSRSRQENEMEPCQSDGGVGDTSTSVSQQAGYCQPL